MNNDLTRRGFIQTAAAGSAAMAWMGADRGPTVLATEVSKPALLGGTPAHKGGWPKWPEWRESWEPNVLKVLRSGRWYGGGGTGQLGEFEAAYAKLLGAKRCVTTASGSTALITAMHALGVDAGDEVIVSPYTFVASYNTIFMHKALPVMADTNPATLTMDPASIESRITERTRAIMPVHICGIPCDMDPINAIAKKHNLTVVEDACQAWLSQYKGRKCGTLGDLGCFSFQESKHLPAGEGGAITGNSDELLDRCESFHNCGRPFRSVKGKGWFMCGTNFRMKHYQAAILLAQLDKLQKETEHRWANADYLSAGLKQIPGVQPVELPENSRSAWYSYAFGYDAAQFSGLPRANFLRAMHAEGIPCGAGYSEQYFDGAIDEAIASRGFQRLFSPQRLKAYRDSLQELKGNKQACETAVTMSQTVLLGDRSGVDHVLEAIRKVHAYSAELAKRA